MRLLSVVAVFMVADWASANLDAIFRNPRSFTKDGEVIWQGDMVLTDEQVAMIKGEVPEGENATEYYKRKMDQVKWNQTIRYYVTDDRKPFASLIREGLNDIEAAVCVKFQEVSTPPASPPYISIINAGDGACWSSVGMVMSKGQELSLGKGCENKQTVIHETLHALGSQHEQCRPDRDQFLKIMWANIENGENNFNFANYPNSLTYGVPYDYMSVMQYGPTDFSINGKRTMVPYDVTKEFLMRSPHFQTMSHRDKSILNRHYQCDANCPIKTTQCQNAGYVDQTCSGCICPPGTTGANCETVTGEYYPEPCKTVYVTAPATVTSPNYPNNYPKDLYCHTVITPPAGKRTRIQFDDFDMIQRYAGTGKCEFDKLEIRYGTGSKYYDDPDQFCEGDLLNKAIEFSDSNPVVLYLKTRYDWNRGYKAQVTFV